MSLYYQSNNGTTWPLDGTTGVTVLEETRGLYEIPADLSIDQRVGADGGVLTNSRFSPRPVDLVVLVEADDLLTAWAQLSAAFRAGGVIRHEATGRVRELRQLAYQSSSPRWGRDLTQQECDVMTVSMLALDPWWYGTAQVVSLVLAGSSIPWNSTNPWNAALPWNGGATAAIVVEGDAPAFPVVDAYGPYTQITVSLADGVGWQSTAAAAAGQRLTVDHRPGFRGPKAEGAAYVDWSLLTEASRLWSLPPGDRTIIVGITGDTGATTATLTWEPRWLTP